MEDFQRGRLANGALNALLVGHGYIGAFLKPALEAAGHTVAVCDRNAAKLAGVANSFHCRYQDLTVDDLAGFETILWFAGHSSVSKAIQDPDGAVANNCFDLLRLAKRKLARTRMIYASTASLYSVEQIDREAVPPAFDESETRINPVNPYDCSKMAFDVLAACFTSGLTGLRLGSVSGYTRFVRDDLVFNSLNRAAMRERRIRVSNRHAHRSILFLDDLARYVSCLLRVDEPLPPILNVGSRNVSIGELADAIAAFHGVPVEEGPGTKTYSFRMDCRRIRALCGPPREASLAERCAAFATALAADKTEAPSPKSSGLGTTCA